MKASEVVRNVVKEKLTRNEVVASMTIRLSRGVEIAQLAKTAGFDMIYIDLEHSTLTLEMTGQICLAALSAGVAPMVRVPANTPDYIQRVLDGGALGIIAPASARRRRRARWSRRRSSRRSASAAPAAPCRICNIVRSRPRRPMPRSTTPPW